MKIFITDEQKAELEHLHHTCRDKRECDRIKAVLLASEGWSSVMIAQALRLHETTVFRQFLSLIFTDMELSDGVFAFIHSYRRRKRIFV